LTAFRRTIFGAGLLILALSAFMIAEDLVGGWSSIRLAANGRVATGKVVDLKMVKMGAVKQAAYPIIEFTSQDGRTQRFASELAGSGVPATIGEAVNVRYDANDPANATIDSFGGLIGPTLIRVAFAILPVGLLGLVMVWFSRFGADRADAELVKGRPRWIPGWFPP
jgi:hypothetical protein